MSKNNTTRENGNFGSTEDERNNHEEGRSGSGTKIKNGPAVKSGPLEGNKTMSGGINRATRGE